MASRLIYRQIARLHIENLDQAFLSSLGETFLTELYRAMDSSEGNALFYEMKDGKVIGFVSGGTGMGVIYKNMFARVWAWFLPLSWRLLNLKTVSRIIDILRYSRDTLGDCESRPKAELYSIAVGSDGRGKGVAQRLYASLLSYFEDQKTDSFAIIVGKNLTSAHKFYQKQGATLVGDVELHDGETSSLYIHSLKNNQ